MIGYYSADFPQTKTLHIMPLTIATWNINSVRLRLPLLKKLQEAANPDVICLQETKVADELFPLQDIHALGYTHSVFSGEKGYNGVAILSRVPLTQVNRLPILDDIIQARHISAVLPDGVELHNFYVPAGGDIPDPAENPKFDHKLRFVDAMRRWFSTHRRSDDKMILVGDLNIAPLEHDVWSHKQLLTVVSHTPVEVEKLTQLQNAFGWQDILRQVVSPSKKLYSWWSYRNRDWRKSDRGRRLDHVWATSSLENRFTQASILKDARDWDTPSDHVPVIVTY